MCELWVFFWAEYSFYKIKSIQKFVVSLGYVDKNEISVIYMNAKQEVSHSVDVVVAVMGQSQSQAIAFCWGSCKEASNEISSNLAL